MEGEGQSDEGRISSEGLIDYTLSQLSKLVNKNCKDTLVVKDEEKILDKFLELFTKVALSDHMKIFHFVVNILSTPKSTDGIQVQCKIMDTLCRIVKGDELGLSKKYGKWKEIITNELVSDTVNIFKTIQTNLALQVKDKAINTAKLCSCFKLLCVLVNCNPDIISTFKDKINMEELATILKNDEKMDEAIAESLLQLLTISNSEQTLIKQRVITLEDLAVLLIDLLPNFDEAGQRHICETLRVMCASLHQNRLICCKVGMISNILQILREFHAVLSTDIKDTLISIMEILGCLSISTCELKLLITLFSQTNSSEQFSHTDRLVQALERMSSQSEQISMQYQPRCFIDFYDIYEQTYIKCPSIQKWNGKGITVHTWICLDFTLPNNVIVRNWKVRHVLYSFQNAMGEGFEAFFTGDGFLVVGIYTKKEFLTTTVISSPFRDQEWHALTIVHSKKLLGKATVTVYVDGCDIHAAQLQYPTLSKELCHAHIGYGIRSNHSFVFQTNPPPLDSTKGVTDPELPLFSVAAGKQNHVWGIPCGLKGQMSGFVLFNESLPQEKIKNLVSPGPNYHYTFTAREYLNEDVVELDTAGLLMNIVFCYDAKAAHSKKIIDLAKSFKDKVQHQENLVAKIHRVSIIQETIQALGGLPVLFPLLEQACFKVTRERTNTRVSLQLDHTDEAPRSKYENGDCEDGTGNSKEKVNITGNNSNQNLILQNGGVSKSNSESLVDSEKSDDQSNRVSSIENNELDTTDGKSKVLSDLSISYSPKKYLPKPVRDWVESINEESNSIEVLDKTEIDKTGKDKIDSTNRKASVNTFVRSASNVSVPEERGKRDSASGWTMIDTTIPRTHSEVFKHWFKKDNHDLNGVVHFVSLIRHMIASRKQVQDLSLEIEGLKVIGLLLQDCDPSLINVGFLESVAQLIESLLGVKDELLETTYRCILFDFNIWYRADVSVQIALTQLLHTYIKDDIVYFHEMFGVAYFIRVIEQFYNSANPDGNTSVKESKLTEVNKRDLRMALLGLVFYILKQFPNNNNVEEIIKYIASVVKCDDLGEILDLITGLTKGPSTQWGLIHNLLDRGCYILYRWLVHDMPDDVRFKILNLFITTISNFGLNNSLKQKLLLKDGLFPAIGELLCKQEVNRNVVVSMLKLALSLDTSEQMKADIYTDFNIVLSVVRIAHYLPRPIKLEVAIKIRNSVKLCQISAQRFADQVGWYIPIWSLILRENTAADDIGVMETELVKVVIEIILLVTWNGISGNDQVVWTKRCEAICSLQDMASRSSFLLPALVVERFFYESCLETLTSALKESRLAFVNQLNNGIQILKLVEDFCASKEVFGVQSQKWSLKLLKGIFDLLEAMNAWEDTSEQGGNEWVEVLQIVEHILYQAFTTNNQDILESANYRLTQLLHKKVISSEEEVYHQIYQLTKVLLTLHCCGLSCETLLIVMLHRLERVADTFKHNHQLRSLPSLHKPGDFKREFVEYMQGEEFHHYLNDIEPKAKEFEKEMYSKSSLDTGRLWMNSLSEMTKARQTRQEQLEGSLLNFTKLIYCKFDEKRTDGLKSFEEYKKSYRQKKGIVRKLWQYQKRFLLSERGAWGFNAPSTRHFKLSNTENRYRMRLKLTENFNFNPHIDAARKRDQASITEEKCQHMEDFVMVDVSPSSEAVFSDDDDEIDGDQTAMLPTDAYEHHALENVSGSLIRSCDCQLIILMDVVPGHLELSTTHICFFDHKGDNDGELNYDFRYPLDELIEIFSRRHNLRKTAMEFFLLDRSSFFVNFPTQQDKQRFYKKITSLRPKNLFFSGIQKPTTLLRESGLTAKWVNREISNFEYLMQLNSISGRTYNDLAQYPVFPWILTDYTSENIDLNDESIYRDLSKPIGALNESRAKEIKTRYEQFNEDDSGLIKRSHYFTHYSNPAGVLHYLVRLEPFTSLHIELQEGKFDWADRQFYSIATAWDSMMNGSDVKELTPEFFFFPEFLMNMNSFNFGTLQRSGESVNDVILPPWCKDAYDFINIHVQALESEYVSSHLHEWIDLIFGYKQRGAEAEKAMNVFNHYSYEGAVDLDKIEDPMQRESVEGMINNFGQTPTQLLRKTHPKRKPLQDVDAGKVRVINQIEKQIDPRFALIEILHMSTPPLVFIALSKPRWSIFRPTETDTLLTIHSNGLFGVHSWLPPTDSKSSFTFNMDLLLTSPSSHSQRMLPGLISPFLEYSSKLFAFSSDGHLLVSCGYWDNSIRILTNDRGNVRLKKCICYHHDIVTCISLDVDHSHLISGSADLICAVWKIEMSNGLCSGLSKKPIQTLFGHDSCITAVAMSSDLDLAVSGSKDGTCLVHTIRRGIFVHALHPVHPQYNEQPCTVSQIKLTNRGRIVVLSHCSNSDATVNSRHFLTLYSINGALLANINLNQQLVLDFCILKDMIITGSKDGILQIRRANDVSSVVLAKRVHAPIYTVSATHNGSHIFIGRGDGNILVVCPSLPS